MQESLATARFNDDTPIPLVIEDFIWRNLSTPGYCWYNNDATTYKSTYGALYNSYTVHTGILCPTGWHVPTVEEWRTLIDYCGGRLVAGGKLKENGTVHWHDPNYRATNESGFTALPGGHRDPSGGFYFIDYFGFWWTATVNDFAHTLWQSMNYAGESVLENFDHPNEGYSVRCIRD
jgi:uncharacterized protein (TIGR02145 family)